MFAHSSFEINSIPTQLSVYNKQTFLQRGLSYRQRRRIVPHREDSAGALATDEVGRAAAGCCAGAVVADSVVASGGPLAASDLEMHRPGGIQV